MFPLSSLGKETQGIPILWFAENISVKSPARRVEPHPKRCESRGRSTVGFLPDDHNSWGLNTPCVFSCFYTLNNLALCFLSDHGEGLKVGGGLLPTRAPDKDFLLLLCSCRMPLSSPHWEYWALQAPELHQTG